MIHSGAKQQNLAPGESQGKTRPRYEAFSDILPDLYHLYIYPVSYHVTPTHPLSTTLFKPSPTTYNSAEPSQICLCIPIYIGDNIPSQLLAHTLSYTHLYIVPKKN